MTFHTRRGGAALSAGLAFAMAIALTAAPCLAASGLLSAYVLLGEDGARVARALTEAPDCPSLVLDGRAGAMSVRAPAGTVAQRTTRSSVEDSKPSVFSLLTCEAVIPRRVRAASIDGRPLPLPPAEIRRLVVFGDTGCRVKRSDNAYQPCNDPQKYPFARIAATAAKWKPDLVVHVGDYLYRENACAADQTGCAGSPWGYGSDAWQADFFTPADPLLRAAPWAVVRGNHESCARAGQGWWRFLDPRPPVVGRDCNDPANDGVGDYSDPYGVPLGDGVQLIVYDSSNVPGGPIAADDPRAARYRETYEKIDALTRRADHNILADHHPVLGFAARLSKTGEPRLDPGNGGLQSVFGAINPMLFPPKVDFLGRRLRLHDHGACLARSLDGPDPRCRRRHRQHLRDQRNQGGLRQEPGGAPLDTVRRFQARALQRSSVRGAGQSGRGAVSAGVPAGKPGDRTVTIPAISATSVLSGLQSLVSAAQGGAAALTGQNLPSSAASSTPAAITAQTASASSQFSASTLASLLSAQTSQSSGAATAASLHGHHHHGHGGGKSSDSTSASSVHSSTSIAAPTPSGDSASTGATLGALV